MLHVGTCGTAPVSHVLINVFPATPRGGRCQGCQKCMYIVYTLIFFCCTFFALFSFFSFAVFFCFFLIFLARVTHVSSSVRNMYTLTNDIYKRNTIHERVNTEMCKLNTKHERVNTENMQAEHETRTSQYGQCTRGTTPDSYAVNVQTEHGTH